jgi:MoxR-vWA-beta-propeller ternary system domain bpX5
MPVMAWQPRAVALTPAGLVAPASLAPALLALLRRRKATLLAALSVVATRDLLVLLGAADALPWLDGVRYCAPDPQAGNLWTPTHLMPSLPVDLVQTSLIERAASSPVLLWHAPEQLLPLAGAPALTPSLLDWLDGALA